MNCSEIDFNIGYEKDIIVFKSLIMNMILNLLNFVLILSLKKYLDYFRDKIIYFEDSELNPTTIHPMYVRRVGEMVGVYLKINNLF